MKNIHQDDVDDNKVIKKNSYPTSVDEGTTIVIIKGMNFEIWRVDLR